MIGGYKSNIHKPRQKLVIFFVIIIIQTHDHDCDIRVGLMMFFVVSGAALTAVRPDGNKKKLNGARVVSR